MSGTVSSKAVIISEDSGFLRDLKDVVIASPTHDQTIGYDATNWISASVSLDDLSDVSLKDVSHNDVLIWDASTNQWKNGKLTSLLTTANEIVNGIVSIKISVYAGAQGDAAKSLCVAFTGQEESGYTLTMASCGDNNAVYKKEPADLTFTFLTTLNIGDRYTHNLPAGTVFASEKGLAGCTAPFPTPFGVSCLTDTYFRFYAFRFNVYVYATSAGRDSLVTLYASDETTIVDGPKFIRSYGSTTLLCNTNDEFVVKSTTDIFCGTGTSISSITVNANVDVRLIPPMKTELIVHNRFNRVSAQFADTSVTYYKRNMESGTVTVQSGTPFLLGSTTTAGSDARFANNGWLILRSDKPICSFTGADNHGWNATEAWPMEFLAQRFPIYSTIDTNVIYSLSGINVCSPYEGTARIYNEARTLVHTFEYTRGTSPPVTPGDQAYPAAGQSSPGNDGYASLQGGWIDTSTPAVCVINFNGASGFGASDNGDETVIPGTSPEHLKAVIRKDPDGFLRRRTIDTNGNETWVVC